MILIASRIQSPLWRDWNALAKPKFIRRIYRTVLTMFPPSPQFGGQSGIGPWNFGRVLLVPTTVRRKAAVKISFFMTLAYEITRPPAKRPQAVF
jgi:hypothetical protein